MNKKSSRGFTLIELLTVIAIIGILAGIIIPTVGSVKTSANKAKSKVQFNQWSSSIELFRQEYGYYPDISNGSKKVNPDKFAGALTGRNLTGTTKLAATDPNLCGNKRILSFYSIADSELNEARDRLVDAFGNTDIAVFVDSNLDGIINSSDGLNATTAVTPIDGGSVTPASGKIDTSNGVRASSIFYSAGKGASGADIVYSWQ